MNTVPFPPSLPTSGCRNSSPSLQFSGPEFRGAEAPARGRRRGGRVRSGSGTEASRHAGRPARPTAPAQRSASRTPRTLPCPGPAPGCGSAAELPTARGVFGTNVVRSTRQPVQNTLTPQENPHASGSPLSPPNSRRETPPPGFKPSAHSAGDGKSWAAADAFQLPPPTNCPTPHPASRSPAREPPTSSLLPIGPSKRPIPSPLTFSPKPRKKEKRKKKESEEKEVGKET